MFQSLEHEKNVIIVNHLSPDKTIEQRTKNQSKILYNSRYTINNDWNKHANSVWNPNCEAF